MAQKADTKTDLLNQLTIDRASNPVSSKMPLGKTLFVAFISVIIGVFVSRYFFVPENSSAINTNETRIQKFTELEQPGDAKSRSKAITTTNSNSPTSDDMASKTILNASGYITARRMATVSAQIMGLIKEVNVEEGMTVKKGQILAKLDDTIPRVRLERAKAQFESTLANLRSTKASLAEAQRQYQRVMSNGYSSDADKTKADTNRKMAEATFNQISANLNVARIEVQTQQDLLAQYTIRAPFAGVVTKKNAQPGEIVSPGSAGGGFTRTGICTIVDMRSLEIEVDVNESFIGRVSAGQIVEAHLDAYLDWAIPASVIAIIPTADRGKATVRVRIKIDINSPKILPDMGVKVAFLKSTEQE